MNQARLNSGHKFAILLLIAASSTQLTATPTNGQVRQANGGKQQSKTNLLPQNDQLVAPFYSIKDGKTSAHRIQQQQQAVVSKPTTIQPVDSALSQVANDKTLNWRQSSRSQSATTTASNSGNDQDEATTTKSTTNFQDNAAGSMQNSNISVRMNDNNRKTDLSQQQPTANGDAESSLAQSAAGGSNRSSVGDNQSVNGNENISQLRMTINSFNQLALDDFVSSTSPPTNKNNDMTTTSSTLGTADQQQQQLQLDSVTTSSSLSAADIFKPTEPSANLDIQAPKLVMQPLNQQQVSQFTTATGFPISPTPNSLSMSLDGMIMSSRPRSLNPTLANGGAKTMLRQVTTTSGSSSLARSGELTLNPAEISANLGGLTEQLVATGGQFNVAAKSSRRVPFSGIPFSSPATKGQRTRPRANNQVDSQANQSNQQQQSMAMDGIFGPRAVDLMAGLQLDPTGSRRPLSTTSANTNISPSQNQVNEAQFTRQQQQQPFGSRDMKQINQMLTDANIGSIMQQQLDLSQGFDDEQQQNRLNMQHQQQLNGDENLPVDGSNGLEFLMKNMMTNSAMTSQLEPGSRVSNSLVGAGPNEMVMSVMSSADGKDRRLVMIARDTLESLQRFAAQNQQPNQTTATQTTKGKSASRQNRPMQLTTNRPSDPANINTGSTVSRWWPNGQNTFSPNLSTDSPQQLQNTVPTTLSPILRGSTTGARSQQREEVQLQSITTTLAPLSTFYGGDVMQTTTQQPAVSMTTTQGPEIRQYFVQESKSRASDTSNQLDLGNITNSIRTIAGEGFREVPVSTPDDGSIGGDLQQKRQQLSGNGRQQVAKSSVKSKTNGKLGSQPSNGKQPVTGNSSLKQLTGGTTNGQQKGSNGVISSSVKTNGKKKNNGASNGKQTSSTTSNKQQKNGKTGSRSNNGSKKSLSGQIGQGGNNKKQQSVQNVGVTSGQQQPLVMMSRVLDLQSAREIAPNNKLNATLSEEDEFSMSTQSSRQQTFSNQEDQVGGQPQVQTATSASSAQNKYTNAQQQTTQSSLNSIILKNDEEEQQVVSRGMQDQQQLPVRGNNADRSPTSTGLRSSLMAIDVNLEKQLDEIERGRGGLSLTSNQPDQLAISNNADPLEALRAAIPGEPQVDYPIHSSPPKTSFDCMSQSCPGGYYADIESQCQVFHICQNDGRSDTFLCPNGTIFSQQHFVCVWWWQVDCQQSTSFYKLNDVIYCNSMFPSSGAQFEGAMGLQQIGRSSGRLNGTIMMNGRTPFDGSANELNDLNSLTPTESNSSAAEKASGFSTTSSSPSTQIDLENRGQSALNAVDSSSSSSNNMKNVQQQQQHQIGENLGDLDLNQQQQQQELL